MRSYCRCFVEDPLGLARTCLTVLLAAVPGFATAAPPPADIDFARDIQPLLAEKCLLCHGTDDQQNAMNCAPEPGRPAPISRPCTTRGNQTSNNHYCQNQRCQK